MGLSPAVLADRETVVSCALAPRRESVRTAREFTRLTLNRWELGDLFDDIALVASELVTNALRYGLPAHVPEPRSIWGRRGAGASPIGDRMDLRAEETAGSGYGGTAENPGNQPLIRLSLVRSDPQVVCAVTDPCENGPVPREADWVAESGRGLHLVESFSQSWGWHPVAVGKVVWAVFELQSHG
ncbi:ATP-binding protein [Streptacidiphilus fuscans]|uniref:ATP-binding protein n=1 Tax=Streptacidiphilus fuscans TaxID=2789292 RepID=A0A931FFE5_9ACTN|nr:ATP-binding protein [Streptacidiphilus fuscans]MBF9070190.1 ATP-binding protein [Streptacidiphilus fuscans]